MKSCRKHPADAIFLFVTTATLVCVTFGAGPSVSVKLSSSDVKLGATGTFYCTVSGSPLPVITSWTIGLSKPLPVGDFRYLLNSQKTTLRIRNVRVIDETEYYCHATTSDGKTFSAYDRLIVIVAPVVTPKGAAVVEGQPAVLECLVDQTAGVLIYWYFNDNLMSFTDSRYTFEDHRQRLRFHNTTRAFNGTYKCSVGNSRYFLKFFVTLIVQFPPSIVDGLSDQTVYFGETATLFCVFTGQPLPSISFLHNGNSLDTRNKRYQIIQRDLLSGERNSSLIISNAQFSDAGKYSCLGHNKHSPFTSKEVELTVQPHIQFPLINKAITVKLGSDEVILCVPNATKINEWKWNDEDINFSASRFSKYPDGSLLVKDFAYSDKGRYRCTAQVLQGVLYGEITVITEVSVKGKPSAPVLQKPAFSIQNSSLLVALNWTSPKYTGGSEVYYVILWQSLFWKRQPVNNSDTAVVISLDMPISVQTLKFEILAGNSDGETSSNTETLSVGQDVADLPTVDISDGNVGETRILNDNRNDKNLIPIIAGSCCGGFVAVLIVCAVIIGIKRKRSHRDAKIVSSVTSEREVVPKGETLTSQTSVDSQTELVPGSRNPSVAAYGSDNETESVFTLFSTPSSLGLPVRQNKPSETYL